MAFEIELLNERFDYPEDKIWRVLSFYWEIIIHDHILPRTFVKENDIIDIRNSSRWHGNYDGIELDISFFKDGNRLILFGVTHVGENPFSRYEHILGFIEVNRTLISSDTPVDVRIVSSWKPVYLVFKEMADSLIAEFKRQPVDKIFEEMLEFKSLVERQTYKDIFVQGRPQENIARAFLQTFLKSRSYREVSVRGGQSDILVFDKIGRFLYETKIWRGNKYYMQGRKEIEEYILGENDDNNLTGIFYVIFDSTASGSAHKILGSDITRDVIAKRTIHAIIININLPRPSRKI